MKYLPNDRNIVRDAALTASNIVPSNVIYRTDDAPKVGGGHVELSGDYVGGSDTTIDIKIVDETISGARSISAPSFVGVGNATMTDIASDTSLNAQIFTVTLEDLGTATEKAYAPFQGVTLQAKDSGPGGNAITLSIDNSAIVVTPTEFAIQEDLSATTNEYVGDKWDFGASVLNPNGTIPDTAPRLSFGADPQIYRQFKFYRDGHYIYGFSPPPIRSASRGTIVNIATGSRSITITDGVSSDTMTAITTVYDALSAIRDHSSLVDVIGVIINDKTPSGQGATDLSLFTSSYVVGVSASGGDTVQHAELLVTPATDAPSEQLLIKCIDATLQNAEHWSVIGDISGQLADAQTGNIYVDGKYAFTIPLAKIAGTVPKGQILIEFLPNGDRESMPSICPVLPTIGAANKSGVWEFVYALRPGTTCDCTTGDLTGGPNDDCLGINPETGGDMSDESRMLRLQKLQSAYRYFVNLDTGNQFKQPAAAMIDYAEKSAAILKKSLDEISTGTPLSKWTTATVYAVDQQRVPTVANGYRYAVTVGGTSGGSEPTFPTTIGATVTDGGVTWQNVGKTAFAIWDDVFNQWFGELLTISGSLTANQISSEWQASHAYTDAVVRPTFANTTGHLYRGSGTSDASEPTWPLNSKGTVKDATAVWVEIYKYWSPITVYKVGDFAAPGDDFLWVVKTGGTSGSSEPNWYSNVTESMTDGGVTWVRTAPAILDSSLGNNQLNDEHFQRWQSLCDEAAAAAGVDPNFKSASTDGDGCWRNVPDADHWWFFNGTDPYLPIFTGVYYPSSKLSTGPDGKPFATSTQEFGFGPKFGCPENLVIGDIIRITINASGTIAGRGYQAGDQFSVAVNHAIPVPFGGGQDGDDTLTFSVIGTDAGRLDDYALVTTALAPYDNGHLSFTITPGGIALGLGDTFTFSIEGGHFQWQQDGGGYSSSIAITATPSLVDGLVANFIGGSAPSWRTGDIWSFKAEAVNGVDSIRQPTDARIEWTGSTVIVIDPGSTEDIEGVLIGDHTIPDDATILLEGSDNNFSTSPLSVTIPWKERHVWFPIVGSRAKYRLTINKGGSIQWLNLLDPFQAAIRSGVNEAGRLTKRWRMPNFVTRKALGAQITHDALTKASVDDFLAMLNHACEFDDGRIGIVPNDSEDEVGIVAYTQDTLELTDALDYQPTDPANRLISVTLQLDAVS